MKKILSIDGGGIRGIIPGQVLIALEEKLQQKSGNPQARLSNFFDFMAGSSSGGILACIYLCPAGGAPTIARFSAKQAVELYIENGGRIFGVSPWKRLCSFFGIAEEKYDETALESVLQHHFEDIRLSQLLKPCLITAYDIERRKAHFFTQHDAINDGEARDFYVKDVCRATSAAPTYFEPAKVKSLNGVAYPLIDGGVFVNNPALSAYSEVRGAGTKPTAKDMLIVSLGTGAVHKPYEYSQAKGWGTLQWARPLIDMMMSGAAEVTDYHLTKMYEAVGRPEQYIRIQPQDMAKVNVAIDDASPRNIRALVELGKETARNCDETLEKIADILLGNPRDEVAYV